ncbi:MAG: hypothetical protein LUD17_00730 [Bacteroidales bacterium]|nr:hypothetical protein [Bacteroidales bacterium]
MEDTAILSNEGNMTVFHYGDQTLKFRAPDCLVRYIEVKLWDEGYIEVMTLYDGHGIVEEYIDLIPILDNLYIKADEFLKPIKYLKISYE